jgi:hypothetical protein
MMKTESCDIERLESGHGKCLLMHSTDPLGSFSGIKTYQFDDGNTIYDRLEEIGQIKNDIYFDGKPCYVTINGSPILRKRYSEINLKENDIVIIQTQPWGGGGEGGSDPMRVMLTIGVIVLAAYTGQVWLAAYGPVIAGLGTVAVAVAGGLLIDIIAPVEMPEAQKSHVASPTYDLRAQGNVARLGEVVPSRFGAHYFYPDFGAIPYVSSRSPSDTWIAFANNNIGIDGVPDYESFDRLQLESGDTV